MTSQAEQAGPRHVVPPGCIATGQCAAMGDRSNRELRAKKYLEKHNIPELLTYLTSMLLFFQPGK